MQLRLERRPSPIGTMLLVTDDAGTLYALDFDDCTARMERLLTQLHGGPTLASAPAPLPVTRALDRYFDGELDALSELVVAEGGTPFQQTVWRALRSIAPGTTTSYGAIASTIGRAGASRAVGLANGNNPVALVVPCHRVIGKDGSLTGYAGGLDRKRWLLRHERCSPPTALEQRTAPGQN